MKKARMKIFYFHFILFNLKIFGEIVTTKIITRLNTKDSIYDDSKFDFVM